jgi:hypothetical protein
MKLSNVGRTKLQQMKNDGVSAKSFVAVALTNGLIFYGVSILTNNSTLSLVGKLQKTK